MRVCAKAYELTIEFSRYTCIQCASKYLVKAVKLTWLEFTVSAKQEVNRKWCHKMSWGVPDWRVTHRSGVRAEWSGSTRNSTKNLVRLMSLYGRVSNQNDPVLLRTMLVWCHCMTGCQSSSWCVCVLVNISIKWRRDNWVDCQTMLGIWFRTIDVVTRNVLLYDIFIWYICEVMYPFLQILCEYSDGSISRCMKQWDVLYDNWSNLRC